MGNPNYENSNPDKCINNHPILKERAIRNFMHRILASAHCLDLPRCFDAQQYMDSLKILFNNSINTDEATQSCYRCIEHAMNLLRAHGSTLKCELNAQFKLSNANIPYDYERFLAMSSNVNLLFKETASVQSAQLKQKFS